MDLSNPWVANPMGFRDAPQGKTVEGVASDPDEFMVHLGKNE